MKIKINLGKKSDVFKTSDFYGRKNFSGLLYGLNRRPHTFHEYLSSETMAQLVEINATLAIAIYAIPSDEVTNTNNNIGEGL